jgi:hypothetical protein
MKTVTLAKHPSTGRVQNDPRSMRMKVYLAVDHKGAPVESAASLDALEAGLDGRNREDLCVLRIRVDGHPFALGMFRTQLIDRLGIVVPMSAVRVG